jgi:lambda repressor-like predicted transcriptional regulator
VSQHGLPDKAAVPNHALAARMKEKGFSENRLATAAGVDIKTVGRWVRGESLPQAVNARATADALGCDPQALWPDMFPTMQPPGTGTVAVSMYGSRTQVPVHVWEDHFAGAVRNIDILVYAATFLFDTVHGFASTLTDAALRGVIVRFLIGDPNAPNISRRGEEEQIGEAVVARCEMTLALLRPYADTPGFDIRTHRSNLYASIFRVDDTVITNFHIHGSPGRENPVIVLHRHDEPGLWGVLEQSFSRIWDSGQPIQSTSKPEDSKEL